MGWFNRLVTGDGICKSRLHNYKGELIDFGGLRYLPQTVVTTIALKCFGYHFEIPWLGWRAISRLDGLIQRDWKVREFGSGMSTLWLAKRCGQLVSIERNEQWYEKIRSTLSRRGWGHVEYRLEKKETYALAQGYPDQYFDLVIVDGLDRAACMETALKKVKSTGYIHLDNSDQRWEGVPEAEQLALQAVGFDPSKYEYFNDFYPGFIAAYQGMLISLDSSHSRPSKQASR